MTEGEKRAPAERWTAVGVGLLCLALGLMPGTPAPAPAPSATAAALVIRVVGPDGDPVEAGEVLVDTPGRPPMRGRLAGQRTRLALPEGPVRLTVSAPRFVREVAETRSPGEVTIRLRPGAAVAGRVLDDEGMPVVAAAIRIRTDGEADPWQALTDDTGSFAVDTLPEGPVTVEVRAQGFPSHVRRARATTGGAVELTMTLERAAVLTGLVGEPDGTTPARGATALVVGSGIWPARSLPVGDDGRFELGGIPAGVYEVRARRDDLVSAPIEGLIIEPRGTADVRLTLEPGAVLAGRVLAAEDDAPIAGAEVVVTEGALGFSPRAVRTDAEGRFRVDGLRRREHRLAVRADGYVASGQTVDPAETIEVALRRAAIVTGTVVDERGYPIEGASLSLVGVEESGAPIGVGPAASAFQEELFTTHALGALPLASTGELGVTLGPVPPIPIDGAGFVPEPVLGADADAPHVPPSSNVSDDRGRFRLGGVPPGRLQVMAQQAGRATALSDPILVAAGAEVEGIEIVLAPAGAIDGRVVDARGYPVGLVPVQLHDEHEPVPRTVIAAADGTFRFEDVAGVVELVAIPLGLTTTRERAEVEAGATLQVEIRLAEALARLHGRTVDARGYPVAAVRLSLRSLGARTPIHRFAESAEDGTFELTGLPPPPYRVSADHGDYAAVTVEHAEGEEIRIVLPECASIGGRVIDDWSGEPIAGARIELREGGRRTATAITGETGGFELARIAAGEYELAVVHELHPELVVEAHLAARSRGLEDLDLGELRLAPGGGIAGEVVDAYGSAVAGAEVAVGSPPGWDRAVRTDPRGRYAIHGLAAGDYAVSARHPAAGEGETPRPVRVRANEDATDVRITLPERYDAEGVTLDDRLRSGVAVALGERGGETVIAGVASGSEAAEAGLRAGDVVVTVDGEAVTDREQAAELLRGPAGSEAVLEIRRDDETRRLLIPRERYLGN